MYEKYAKRKSELNLTDYKVAQMTDGKVTTATLSEWKRNYESGGKLGYVPKLDKLSAIAKVLDINVAELIE